MQETELKEIIEEIQEVVNDKNVGIFLGKNREGKDDIFFIESFISGYSCRTFLRQSIEDYAKGKIDWDGLIELVLDYGQRANVVFHKAQNFKFLKYIEMEKMLGLAGAFMATREFQDATLQGYESVGKNKFKSDEELFGYIANNFDKILKLMVLNDNKSVSFSESVASVLEEK